MGSLWKAPGSSKISGASLCPRDLVPSGVSPKTKAYLITLVCNAFRDSWELAWVPRPPRSPREAPNKHPLISKKALGASQKTSRIFERSPKNLNIILDHRWSLSFVLNVPGFFISWGAPIGTHFGKALRACRKTYIKYVFYVFIAKAPKTLKNN